MKKFNLYEGVFFKFQSFLKILKAMRITLILLFVPVLQLIAGNTYSQDTKLSLNLQNESVENVLDEIENQSEFYFVFNYKLVDVKKQVNIEADKQSVSDVLAMLFPDSEVDYVILDRQILLSPKEYLANTKIRLQPRIITGTITDLYGDPLPGAAILIKGRRSGVVTNIEGNYSIELPEDAEILEFSYMGMITQEITVGDQTQINVILEEDVFGIDEVVAVGYGRLKKKEVVGSVVSVRGEELQYDASGDITNALSGRLPGVSVRQESGEPGRNGASLIIRGRTTLHEDAAPLVVVDGIPGRSLNEIDPADIEDITILKDASAAIYGASAANGVILVTTKNAGKEKTRLTVDSYVGFMTPTMLPDLCSSAEFATMLSEYEIYEGFPRSFSDKDIELYASGVDPWEHPNTNWLNAMIADWTTRDRHSISLDGNFKNIAYYFSLGLRNDRAFYKEESSRYRQYNARAKLDVPITKWLNVGYNFAGFQTERKYPTMGAFGGATFTRPTTPAVWPNGVVGVDPATGNSPVTNSTFAAGHDSQTDYITQNTFYLKITPLENLNIQASYSHDVTNQYHHLFSQKYKTYNPIWETGEDTNGDGYIDQMQFSESESFRPQNPNNTEQYYRYLKNLFLLSASYARSFGNHNLSLFGAIEQYNSDGNNMGAQRFYYISNTIQTLDVGAEEEKTNWGERWIYSRRSYIGRLSYNYKEKYLLETTIRRDGSLKYSPEQRWGNFPSVMLGWRASEEEFWKTSIGFINYFKLRASYGLLGMDPGDPFQYLNQYGISSGLPMGTSKTPSTTVYQLSTANPAITWEKEKSYNIGFESQFLNNKFSLETDFFYKNRYDILTYRDASVPQYTGVELPQENIAEVDNRGFEISAAYNEQIGKNFRFSLSGNISYFKNKVVYMDEPEVTESYQRREGNTYGSVLAYEAIGVFADANAVESYPHWSGAKPGDVIFKDMNGDGEITAADKILFGPTDIPKTFYGINLDMSYKNWSLSILVQGQGTVWRNHYEGDAGNTGHSGPGNYRRWLWEDRWTPGGIPGVEPNLNTDIPRAHYRANEYWSYITNDNTFWYGNMAYTRLKNIVLTYSLPKELIGKIGLSKANIYLMGHNLLLLYSAQDKFDPEHLGPQIYPPLKTIAIGANLSF